MKSSLSERFFWGILFIIIGVALTGKQLEFWNFSWYFFRWYYLLGIIGLYLIIIKKEWTGGLIVLLIGFAFSLGDYGYSVRHLLRTFWPVVFILIGIGILLGRNRKKKITGTVHDGDVELNNLFSSSEHSIESKELKSIQVNSTFSETIVDCSQAFSPENPLYIQVSGTFCSIVFEIPRHWTVKNEMRMTASDVKESTKSPDPGLSSQTIIFRGYLSFGSLKIKKA